MGIFSNDPLAKALGMGKKTTRKRRKKGTKTLAEKKAYLAGKRTGMKMGQRKGYRKGKMSGMMSRRRY